MASDKDLWFPPLSPEDQHRVDRQRKRQQKKYDFAWIGFKGKTLWDFLHLLAILAIPIAVALGTAWFGASQSLASLVAANEQQQATTLQKYIDDMQDLVLSKNLMASKPGDEVRVSARIKTLAVLPQLNATRKGTVVRLLSESRLLQAHPGPIVDLRESNLRGADLHDTNLSGTNLDLVDLTGANLTTADLTGASLTLSNLTSADLAGAYLTSADLTDSNLSGTNLRGAYLTYADLRGDNLSGADLRGADLSGADLAFARLNGADLRGANLSGADLAFADLSGADLTGAYLTGAYLKDASVTSEQLSTVYSLHGTVLPDGSKHP